MLVRGASVQPFDFEGLEIRDYTAGLSTGSSLATIHIPPGTRHPRARSERSDKYYYLLSGRVRFGLEEEEGDLAAGDFVLVPQGQPFWYENRTLSPAVLLLVHTPAFDPDAERFVE
ncbi:MAG: cupin domain-containing protein [Anaerolineae bacterium]|nr:cupin domain-containing protein [Anaerolineae bacterium]